MNKKRIERTKRKERGSNERKRETKRIAKILRNCLLDHEIFGGGRLWLLYYS